ncbi:MAG: FtsK/SpoIIIE domain-containing protein [Limnohabitans sp.]
MNIQKFLAPNARAAMNLARLAFGEKTMILSNRDVIGGVEITATAEESAPLSLPLSTKHKSIPNTPAPAQYEKTSVANDTEELAMSTLSFQDYVRERLLRKQHQEKNQKTQDNSHSAVNSGMEKTPALTPALDLRKEWQNLDDVATTPAPTLMAELKDLRAMVEERFSTLAWLSQTQQKPAHSDLTHWLLHAGYSSKLIREVLEQMPQSALINTRADMQAVTQHLSRCVQTDLAGPSLLELGGQMLVVGSKGVGKTTAVATLVAQCVEMHGAASVGLVTLDTSAMLSNEPLRQLTRDTGVVAHLAHDVAAANDLLALWHNKHLVLVDTPGVSLQNIKPPSKQPQPLLPNLHRLLVLNAASQVEVQQATLKAFDNCVLAGALLSHMDEAFRLGPLLDTLILNQVVLRGCTQGMPLAQNWSRPNPLQWVSQTLPTSQKKNIELQETELQILFAKPRTNRRSVLAANKL